MSEDTGTNKPMWGPPPWGWIAFLVSFVVLTLGLASLSLFQHDHKCLSSSQLSGIATVVAPATVDDPIVVMKTSTDTTIYMQDELERFHNLEEAPQVVFKGTGEVTTALFTILYPPWLIEYDGPGYVKIVRENGIDMARRVTDGYAILGDGGTFRLEVVGNSGSWVVDITEG